MRRFPRFSLCVCASALALALASCVEKPSEPASQLPAELVGTWHSEAGSITLSADSTLSITGEPLPVNKSSIWISNDHQIIQVLDVDFKLLQVDRAESPLDYVEPNWTKALIERAVGAYTYTLSEAGLCLEQGERFNRCFTR